LKVIEVQLQSWKIIGERTGYFSWTVGLDKESRAQAKALEDVIERVKSWLISLRVQLDAVAPTLLFGVDDTAGIKFNPIRRLSVPRAQLSHIPAAKLADDILVIMLNEAIATSGMTDGKKALLRQHGLDVVNFFVLHDRKQERELLANRLRDLGAVQVTTALTDATWRDLQIGADVAALDVIAEKWKRGVALLDSPGYKEAPKLEGIHPRDVDTVKALMADLTTFALPGNDPRALARDNAVATLKKASSDLVTAFANDKKNGKEIQDLTTKMLAVL
jgi:hypothetical protein